MVTLIILCPMPYPNLFHLCVHSGGFMCPLWKYVFIREGLKNVVCYCHCENHIIVDYLIANSLITRIFNFCKKICLYLINSSLWIFVIEINHFNYCLHFHQSCILHYVVITNCHHFILFLSQCVRTDSHVQPSVREFNKKSCITPSHSKCCPYW